MNYSEKQKSAKEKIEQLKEYREQVMFYNSNKTAFENPQNSIQLEDNIAFISPLNDVNRHLEENAKTMVLVYNNKGFTTLKYIYCVMLVSILIVIGIIIAHLIGGV